MLHCHRRIHEKRGPIFQAFNGVHNIRERNESLLKSSFTIGGNRGNFVQYFITTYKNQTQKPMNMTLL